MNINNSALVTNIGDVSQTMTACIVSCGLVVALNAFILVKAMNSGPNIKALFAGGEQDFETKFASKGHKIKKEKRKLNWFERKAIILKQEFKYNAFLRAALEIYLELSIVCFLSL